MKKKKIKVIAAAAAAALCFAVLYAAAPYLLVTLGREKINEYLEEYDTGTATYEDVRDVNLHIKDYVRIGETQTSDRVLSTEYWNFDAAIMSGFERTERLGNTFVYRDKSGNTYAVTQTDDWCPFFRVYTVTKGVLE